MNVSNAANSNFDIIIFCVFRVLSHTNIVSQISALLYRRLREKCCIGN